MIKMANMSAWTVPLTLCCWRHSSERFIRLGDDKPGYTGSTKNNTRVPTTQLQRLPFQR